jgi:hypothetical protein
VPANLRSKQGGAAPTGPPARASDFPQRGRGNSLSRSLSKIPEALVCGIFTLIINVIASFRVTQNAENSHRAGNSGPFSHRGNMATPAGFEPAATRLEGECSIQLSYGVAAEAACLVARGQSRTRS